VERRREEAVIGVSMDGLGYGDDGRLWGGEVLVCDLTGYRRVAHLEELPLPGGAAAITQPWRTALGWSYALLGREGLERAAALLKAAARGGADGLVAPTDEELSTLVAQVDRSVNAPLTTSCGRLFDAVGALAGVRHRITYEGQTAIELEMMASGPAAGAGAGPFDWGLDGDVEGAATGARRGAADWVAAYAAADGRTGGRSGEAAGALGPRPAVVRLAPVFAGVLGDLEGGAAPGAVGARLHATVAAVVLDLCRRVRAAGGPAVVVLAGGVFQNRLLADLCERLLEGDGFEVLAAGLVPVNDGGVSLGQAAVAGYTLLERRGELG
jgi:hydrogenase maturation protein HypF